MRYHHVVQGRKTRSLRNSNKPTQYGKNPLLHQEMLLSIILRRSKCESRLPCDGRTCSCILYFVNNTGTPAVDNLATYLEASEQHADKKGHLVHRCSHCVPDSASVLLQCKALQRLPRGSQRLMKCANGNGCMPYRGLAVRSLKD